MAVFRLENKNIDGNVQTSNILRFHRFDVRSSNYMLTSEICTFTVGDDGIVKLINYQQTGNCGKIDLRICICDYCKVKIYSSSQIWLDSNQISRFRDQKVLFSVTWYVCVLSNDDNFSVDSILYLCNDISDNFLRPKYIPKGEFVDCNVIAHNKLYMPIQYMKENNIMSCITPSLKYLAFEKLNHFQVYNYLYCGYGTIEWEKFEWIVGLFPIHCSEINYDLFENLNPKSPSGFYILPNPNNYLHVHKNIETDAIYIANVVLKISTDTNFFGSYREKFNENIKFCLGCHDSKWELLPTSKILIFVKMCQYIFPVVTINGPIEKIVHEIKSLSKTTVNCNKPFPVELVKSVCFPKRKLRVTLLSGTNQCHFTLKIYMSLHENFITTSKYTIPVAIWTSQNVLNIKNCSKIKLYFKFDKNEKNFFTDLLCCSFCHLNAKTEIFVYSELNITNYINKIFIEQI